MKFEIQPEIFDNFIDAICIVNDELYPVYFNASFVNLTAETSERSIRKKKINDMLQLEDFNWDTVKQGALLHLESQVREVNFQIKGRNGQLQVTWKSIQNHDGRLNVVLYFRDVSLEAELTRKYHEQLQQKNETIAALDEHIFQISLIKDVLERATTDDDPMVMLRNLFTNLSHIFEIEYVMYLKEEEENTLPELKTYAGRARIDDRLARSYAESIKPSLVVGDFINHFANDHYWISFDYKDDQNLRRFFIFGKSQKFTKRDEKLIQTLCEPLSFSLDNRELFKKAITDEMTDLYNHRYFKLRLQKEIHAHQENGKKMGLMIMDIDFFKKVNDTYGHLVGDVVLNAAATCLKNFCRLTDVPSRYGGEEFAVILQDVDEAHVFNIGDRLRQSIEKMEIAIPGQDLKIKITTSIGISIFPTNAQTPLDMIALADQCLYECKRTGRNKVVVSSSRIDSKAA